MHYALVADLMTREEFDERVEKKSEELCGVVDEICTAMLVVEELGRSHIKIGEIKTSAAPLVSFFGKVLEVSKPREFQREGGEEGETGLVASITLGDPTGTVKVTLWDALAAGAGEIEKDSVLEVIGKPRAEKRGEVTGLAIRESQVIIVETKLPPRSEEMKTPLLAKVLVVSEIKEITRRDGSISYLQELIIGDPSGTARLISWEPEVFAEVNEGLSYSFSGLTRKEEEEKIEYIAPKTTVITPYPEGVFVLETDASEVSEGKTAVVTGTVSSVSQIKRFFTKRGSESQVKNVKITGKNGKYVFAALWNEAADTVLTAGEEIFVINSWAKPNKFGDMELSVGRGSYIRTKNSAEEFVTVSGIIVPRSDGFTIDDGESVWILILREAVTPGEKVTVSGFCQNGKISVEEIIHERRSVKDLSLKFEDLI